MDEDKDDPLASLPPVPPPPRKAQSFSHQFLPQPSPSSSAPTKRKARIHSLDDNQFLHHQTHQSALAPSVVDDNDDDYDEGFCPRSAATPTTPTAHSSLDQDPLPVFVAAGGNSGIFKLPVRSSVHSSRPLCVELRPHPLKETQVGKFLRNLAYANGQLWAGQENGVRYWNVERAYEPGGGLGGRIRRGDEDASPFHESATTSPTMCLLIDRGSRLVWTGHKDGKIRSWKMDQGSEDTPFKEGLSWQAQRSPVLSMVMTSFGDIWTGSEGGLIKIWPWEAIEKSLSLSSGEKHMAALLVERSAVDLKSQVTVNGVCSISSSDVKCMLSDNIRGKVWAATPLSFSLWNARTKELLKVFNIEGQVENRVEMPVNSEQAVEDEMKGKFVTNLKKEKSPSSFLQRSRNAIMGAADAVRRVATRGTGAFVEETKKTEALLLTADGMIWTGCSNGLLVQWDENGNRVKDFNHHPCAILCFCTFGTRIYVGYISGLVQILDLEGNVITGWIAHTGPVLNLAVGDCQIYSLATHGGIRGWNITSPGPVDNIMRTELAKKEVTFTRQSPMKVLVGTWNVGQGKPIQEALSSWLGSVASDVGIVVVGCQEVDMGAGFLAMSAAKETVGLEGSAVGNLWLDAIGKSLDEGNAFERMGSRQLAGLLIGLWVRKGLRTRVGDVDIAAVACGFGRAIGNKGGVGVRIRVYDRIMCFVNCHLAAHLEAVNRRNADFDHIYRTMAFSKSYNVLNAAAAGVSSSAQMSRGSTTNSANNSDEGRTDLAEADMVVFLGDFNYRLFGISYDEARDFVSQRCFDWLREKDQLRLEMQEGRVFQGMREAVIKFPPTYKFERHQPGLGGYDSGEKKRIPAWCDRVIFRDTQASLSTECGLDCPMVSSVLMYDACMDVTESDHKPVRCKFSVQIAHTDRSVRREELGKIVKSNETINSLMAELQRVPDIGLSTDNVVLKNVETFMLRITNKCADDTAVFKFNCQDLPLPSTKDNDPASDHRPRGSFGFPRWLEVTPAAGVISPGQTVEVTMINEELRSIEDQTDGVPQSWWNEDNRDKEAVLGLVVQGSSSTETKTHEIRVRTRTNATAKAKKAQVSTVPRSEPPRQFVPGEQRGREHPEQAPSLEVAGVMSFCYKISSSSSS